MVLVSKRVVIEQRGNERFDAEEVASFVENEINNLGGFEYTGAVVVRVEGEDRHLHDGDPDRTLCGCSRRVPFLAGSRRYYSPGYKSVHITKARKTDCEKCRSIFRAQVRDRSGKDYETRAEKTEVQS